MNPNESKEMWPTLSEAHGGKPQELIEDGDYGWEIVRQQDDQEDGGDESDSIEIQVVPPSMRKLRHCASSPDLRFVGRALEAVDEDVDNEEEEDVTIATTDSYAVLVSKKKASFLDAILSPSKDSSDERKEENPDATPSRRPKQKPRPKIVVAPIKRCAKSTGDLRSLVIQEDEVLGESDAMDYYHRKAMGATSRTNGLKIRPDEAKRKSITMYKKQLQRQQQAAKV